MTKKTKSALTEEQVARVAKLANLPLTKEELEKYAPQLSAIVGFVSSLQSIDTKNVPPTSQVTGLTNVLREDLVDTTRMLSRNLALANASDEYNGFFKVPAIFE